MRFLVWFVLVVPCLGASTLERVRGAKGLVCGVNIEEGDYSRSDDHGAREDFDRDLCRAVAVAILGRDARVVIKEFPDDSTGAAALLAGKVDLLPTLTLDFSHATGTGVGFSRVVLWDGVGFMVPVGGVKRAEELAGKKVCLLDGTEVEESVGAWLRRKGLEYDPFPFQEEGEMEAAFVTGGCAAIAGDQTRLAATKMGFGPIAGRFRILGGEPISTDPLAAAYARKDGDGEFGEIVDWAMEVLVVAEERGVTAATVKKQDEALERDITVRRLAGKTHELGARLGLADAWAAQVIEAVGNYGEIFARDLGPESAMGMKRGRNRLGRDGGLMVGLPLK